MFDKALKQSTPEDRLAGVIDAYKFIQEKYEKVDDLKIIVLNTDLMHIISMQQLEWRIDFIKSTFFMFIPLSSRDMSGCPIKNARVKPKLQSKIVWNMHADLDELKKVVAQTEYKGRGSSNKVEAINSVNESDDEDVKQAVVAAYNRIVHPL